MLNAFGGGIETLGQISHFVLTLLGHAHRQIALTPALNTLLQGLQTLCELAHNGVHANGHGQTDQDQHPHKTIRRPRPPRRQITRPIAHATIESTWAHAHGPATVCTRTWFLTRSRRATRQQQIQGLAIGQGHLKIHTHTALQLARYRRDQFAFVIAHLQLAHTLRSIVGHVLNRQTPSPTHHQHQNGHTQHHGQPNPQVQMF